MSDTARDYQTTEPATTEGLEDLFSVVSTSSGPVSGPSRDEDAGPSQSVSALQAAQILGINKRSVIRLIQEQKLEAIKRDGKYLIDREAVESRKRAGTVVGPSRDEGPDDVALDIEDAGPSRDDGPPSYVAVDIEGPGLSRDDGPPVSIQIQEAPANSIDAYKLLKELEGATYRIGYLEAQLAERDQQIKLLTDSQHKPGWWARFKKWCAGSSV